MTSLVFRIRKKYFDLIVEGHKNVEYRKDSPYWRKRFRFNPEWPILHDLPKVAVFICGKRVHRREIEDVHYVRTPSTFSEQGKQDVPSPFCFAICLGDVVKKCQCTCGCKHIVEDPMQSCCNFCNGGWCEGQ